MNKSSPKVTPAGDTFLEAIAATLSSPFTGELEDLPAYDIVDEAMMKRGTLAHSSIDWPAVEEAATQILAQNVKDLRLIEAVCLSRMAKPARKNFLTCLSAFLAFLELPKDLRRPDSPKQFTQILDRLCTYLGKRDMPGPSGHSIAELQQCLNALITNDELQSSGQNRLFRQIKERLDLEQSEKPPEVPDKKHNITKSDTSTSKKAHPPKSSQSSETTQDHRAFKRQVGEVADMLFQTDPASPVSYQLRRMVCWMDITALPPLGANGHTIIPAISPDTHDRYLTAIDQKEFDDTLCQRLERTLFSMPFWLDGQYLASRLASLTNRKKVKQAIHSDVQAFLLRLPDLATAKFEDGSPIIGEMTHQWLEEGLKSDNEASTPTAVHEKFPLPEFSAFDDNLEMLLQWNGSYKSQSSPRQKAMLELTALEMLQRSGLTALASDQANRLSSRAEQMDVTEWDPEFFQRAQAIVRLD